MDRRSPILGVSLLLASSNAWAGEVFGGVATHDIDLGIAICCFEDGADLQFGLRSRPLGQVLAGEARAYAFGSINTEGGVDFAAAGIGLRWPIGTSFYLQPGLGVAVHDGPGGDVQRRPDRLYLGSRLLFEPELALGWRLSDRWSAELAYVHLSHAKLAGDQNPGLDQLGLRLTYRFGDRDEAASIRGTAAPAQVKR